MKEVDLEQCVLPANRTGRIVQLLAKVSVGQILFLGLLAYALPAFIISAVEFYCSPLPELAWIKAGETGITEFWSLVYFNFITILTIGYGDYAPHGFGARCLSVVEALIGTGTMTVTMSALIAKFLSPPRDAIVFSKYAYYCIEPQRFLVIYLNTTRNRIVNADQSAYFKLAGDWGVAPSVRSPLITKAVQTFYVEEVAEQDLIAKLEADHPDDARDLLRFGISGHIGGGSFSAAIEYGSNDILVIPNRDELTAYAGFWRPDLSDKHFREMFHYRPANALTLVEYVKAHRGNSAASHGV